MVKGEDYGRLVYNTKAWRELRQNLIIKRGAKCEECGKDFTSNTSKLVGHHIKPLTAENYQDVNIAYNPSNIKIICTDCHNKEHERFEYKGHKVYVVYGSPMAGKSQLVSQMCKRGDLIVNTNAIYEILSGMSKYERPNNLLRNVLAVREDLIEQVRMRLGYWNSAYIIGTYPRKLEREQLAKRLNAELIYVDSTEDECLARCELLGAYCKKWQGYVNKWWSEYEQ